MKWLLHVQRAAKVITPSEGVVVMPRLQRLKRRHPRLQTQEQVSRMNTRTRIAATHMYCSHDCIQAHVLQPRMYTDTRIVSMHDHRSYCWFVRGLWQATTAGHRVVGIPRCIVAGNVGASGNPLPCTPNLIKCCPTLPHCPTKTFPLLLHRRAQRHPRSYVPHILEHTHRRPRGR